MPFFLIVMLTFFVVMLSVIMLTTLGIMALSIVSYMLNALMVNPVMLNAVILNVAAPSKIGHSKFRFRKNSEFRRFRFRQAPRRLEQPGRGRRSHARPVQSGQSAAGSSKPEAVPQVADGEGALVSLLQKLFFLRL
jgi:hypothetical protein